MRFALIALALFIISTVVAGGGFWNKADVTFRQAGACPKTKFVYLEGTKPDKNDERVFARALVHCGELYPKSPCPKTIYKKQGQSYSVVCGGKPEQESILNAL